MADLTRPNFGEAWASEGEKLSPGEAKLKLGWVQEMMTYQYENYLQARQDEAILYLLQKGVPEYSPTQEYTANKSVVVYQGNLYMATSTVTGVLPTVTASWKRISPTVGANGAVSISSGGTGATTVSEARTNLGLGTASTVNLPTTNGVVVRSASNTLISRLLTGTSGNISVTNPDGVAGNINIDVGSNVAKLNTDSSWTSKGGITLPKGSSGERGVEVPGKIRYNTELQKFEGYNGTDWNVLGATSEIEVTTLSGNGVDTDFVLNTEVFSVNSTDVFINGVYQNKDTYTISGANITFSEVPTAGVDNIQVLSRRVVDLGVARASQVEVEDTSNLYSSTTVEGALREVGDKAKFIKNAILSYPDYATASAAAATLPDGQVVDVLDEKKRYKVQAGALVFVVNLDQLRLDLASTLDPAKGAAMVGYKGETLADVIARHEGLSVYVESFRKVGDIARSDSNTIRAALAFIQTTQAGRVSRLVFESGRIYTYDRTAELTTINDLTIDLNGATLVRAAAATTRTTLAQAAGTGQSSLYLAEIPSNWEVGDYLTAYTDNTHANTSKNVVVIQSIDPDRNRVTVNAGFGPIGELTTILPVGTKVAKKFQAFAGRPSSTEAGIPTSGGVNSNIHIINGTIDGNSSNQENNSWYFNSEIMLHGRASSVRNMRFRNTAGECIVGHGLRVDGNEFRNLSGSAFHLSMHDDSLALSSASWFTNNVINGTNLATDAVSGHSEGAVTFSWGAGRLIVSGNEFFNGTESVLGAFGPANESANPDKWLIFTDNICRNFNRLFYSISSPAEGIVVTNNILVDCNSATSQMEALLTSKTNTVGGNVCVGNSAVAGAYRATQGVFGTASATIRQLKLLAGSDVPGMDMSRLSEAVSATTGPKPFHAFVMSDNTTGGGLSFFSPSGNGAGDFFAQWKPSTKMFELFGNAIGGGVRVGIKRAFLNLDATTRTYPNNDAAVAAGLLAGDVYQTPTGQLMRVL